jgi:thiol-disulfide isomerase/thioredoxin
VIKRAVLLDGSFFASYFLSSVCMKRALGLIVFVVLTGCGGVGKHRIVFHLIGGFNRQFFIERLNFNGDMPTPLDSGAGRNPRDSFVYFLPPGEPTVYHLRLQGKVVQPAFVYDSSDIEVYYNYTNSQYHVVNSPASEEWRNFVRGQDSIGRQQRLLDGLPADSARPRAFALVRERYMRDLHFADTVSNPALFLLAYNNIDFGSDYKGLEQFIQRAGRRFPGHAQVQELVKSTVAYARTFGSPLQLGDTLPAVGLADNSGNWVRIGPVAGKYTLIDFWSTWCDQCRVFSAAKKDAWHKADTSRFAIISVAIDAKKETWQKVIQYEQYAWPQLIDEQMWKGPVARTLRFDSIPFNFLLGPDGRIVFKGISSDSLALALASLGVIKNNK